MHCLQAAVLEFSNKSSIATLLNLHYVFDLCSSRLSETWNVKMKYRDATSCFRCCCPVARLTAAFGY
jgi:hypothetical protein